MNEKELIHSILIEALLFLGIYNCKVNIIIDEKFPRLYPKYAVGFIDFKKNIHLKREFLLNYINDNSDTLIHFALMHELIHYFQYSSIFKTILCRTILRSKSEKEANEIAQKFEKYIKEKQ